MPRRRGRRDSDGTIAPRGPLAQLVEQGTFNRKVTGSIPVRPTISALRLRYDGSMMKIQTITLSVDAYHEDPVSIELELGKVIGSIQAALAAVGHEPSQYSFNLAFNLVDPDDKVGWSRYEMYRIRMQLAQIDAALGGADDDEGQTPEDRNARQAVFLAHEKSLRQELHELEERDDVTQKNPWE